MSERERDIGTYLRTRIEKKVLIPCSQEVSTRIGIDIGSENSIPRSIDTLNLILQKKNCQISLLPS